MMIDRNHRLSVTRQATLLGISRGSVHYTSAPVSPSDLILTRRLDELHVEFPCRQPHAAAPDQS